eukprot:COSAG06_NODE_156_length_21863_cov_29.245405_13_plen_130_part_00
MAAFANSRMVRFEHSDGSRDFPLVTIGVTPMELAFSIGKLLATTAEGEALRVACDKNYFVTIGDHHAATDLQSLYRPSPRACSPLGAPSRVPGASSTRPRRGTRRTAVPIRAHFGLTVTWALDVKCPAG